MPADFEFSPKRSVDLVLPYAHKSDAPKEERNALMTQSLPMMSMFMRSKIISWAGVFTALQSWLSEPEDLGKDQNPGWMSLITSFIGVVVCYMDFVFVPAPKGAPPPQAS